jgi:hypothetical protein
MKAMDSDKTNGVGSYSLAYALGKLESELARLRDETTAKIAALEARLSKECATRQSQIEEAKNDANRNFEMLRRNRATSPPTTKQTQPAKGSNLPPFPKRDPKNQVYCKAIERWAVEAKKPAPPRPGPMQKLDAY